MNVEQRVLQAFRYAEQTEPSTDLWSRVVHSIEEDRRHRRRVIGTTIAIATVSIALVAVGVMSMKDAPTGRFIQRETLEALEAIALAVLTIVLGPAIRRFGRGYARDLWPAARATPNLLLRLLDLAYGLVFGGYILLTTQFEFGDGSTLDPIGGQLHDAAERIGGLLLVMGLLHAGTLMVLPVVALVDNSTRRSERIPRWVVMIGLGVLLAVIPVVGLLFAGLSAEL